MTILHLSAIYITLFHIMMTQIIKKSCGALSNRLFGWAIWLARRRQPAYRLAAGMVGLHQELWASVNFNEYLQ